MTMTFKFNLKDPKKDETLLMLHCRWQKELIKVSTKQRVNVVAWDNSKQQCITSKEKFNRPTNLQSENVNKFIAKLVPQLHNLYDSMYVNHITPECIKIHIKRIIESITKEEIEKEEKLNQTALGFFSKYIEKKRIDSHTGRYISERTKVHQRTVLKRLKKFIEDKKLPDDFSTFTSKKFDALFTDWCYMTKKYKQNTVYATYGVLKPLLNAAKDEGFEFSDCYKRLKGKCVDVDAIYLNEEEVNNIYNLDIELLKINGEIDMKSTIEKTRDLFIISCWTGLRRSDINQLNKASFDIEKKTITITPEKTKRPITIPMHPMVMKIWKKYNGKFPKLCDKGKTNNHLRECGRLASLNETIRIVENRGGTSQTLIYKKYQLIGMHTGRRSFATNMYKRRFPTIAIMKLTGHTTETNFLKYIKVSPEENAVMMAEEFFKAQKPFEND